MKNSIKNIVLILAVTFTALGFAGCGYDEPNVYVQHIEGTSNSEVDNTNQTNTDPSKSEGNQSSTFVSTPEKMVVNPKEAIKVAKYSVEIHEGHSHAPNGSRIEIGGVMWSKKFNNGFFHGNPYAESELPLKRYQKLTYSVGADGKFVNDDANSDNILNILSTTPRKQYLLGMMNAIIVKLYDADGNRIDRKLKEDNMKDRVQVFYQVEDVKPSLEKYTLPKDYNKTDICYFWYYDRKPVFDNGKWWDDGKYITDEAVGFRGVIQSLEPKTKFILKMSITILPEGMTKGSDMRNSISPSQEQAQHVVFQANIPIRVITESPNFQRAAEDKYEAETGRKYADWRGSDYDEIDKIKKAMEKQFYEELSEIFTDFTPDRLKELIDERNRLYAEGSQFYL